MYNFANLSSKEKDVMYSNAYIKVGYNKAIIEKDFWVCLVLDVIFNKIKYKDYFTFKGGTSLSKGYDIISRFSEDIDLILNWEAFGVGANEPMLDRSKTGQKKYNKKLIEQSKEFVKNKLVPELDRVFKRYIKDEMRIELDENDENIVKIYYPKLYESNSILQYIRLEIGPLGGLIPSSKIKVVPYVEKELKGIFDDMYTMVLTIDPKRTFWEKITILHSVSNRPLDKKLLPRYSRHYYDIYMFMKTFYVYEALKDYELLNEVIYYKDKFYGDNYSKHYEIKKGNINLVPNEERIKQLKDDYEMMKDMIYGDVPTFDKIIEELKKLEIQIRDVLIVKV